MYDMYPDWGPAPLDEDHPNQARWSLPVREPLERRERATQTLDDKWRTDMTKQVSGRT